VTYATQQNMVDRFGEQELIDLTDRDNTDAINAIVLAGALADADGEIDSYLAGRYKLPLTTTPTVLVRLACDLARYRLYQGQGRPQEAVREAYEDAVRFLRDVSTGKAHLDLDAQQEAPAPGSGPAAALPTSTTAPNRLFTSETLEDF
jgi:phage gp36-like protein